MRHDTKSRYFVPIGRGEYLSTKFNAFCVKHGIHQQLTMANIPQQNIVSERRNQTIIKRAQSMALSCNCLNFLWSKVVNTANYLINISPTRANNGMTSYQVFYNQFIAFLNPILGRFILAMMWYLMKDKSAITLSTRPQQDLYLFLTSKLTLVLKNSTTTLTLLYIFSIQLNKTILNPHPFQIAHLVYFQHH